MRRAFSRRRWLSACAMVALVKEQLNLLAGTTVPSLVKHVLSTFTEETFHMTPSIKSSRDTVKKSIAKGFGAVFIVLCLLAGALALGLPQGSSAASSLLTLTPDADTSIDQASPTKAAATSR